MSSHAEDQRLEYARRYVERGWKVFVLGWNKTPLKNCEECRTGGPSSGDFMHVKNCDHLHCHGFYAATSDIDRVRQMLENPAGGLLAVATGEPSGLVVWDFESTDKGGHGQTGVDLLDVPGLWEEYVPEWQMPRNTLTAISGSGGRHLLFRYPAGRGWIQSRVPILDNVDMKVDGAYVAVPSGPGFDQRDWVDFNVEPIELPDEAWSWIERPRSQRTGAAVNAGFGSANGFSFTHVEIEQIAVEGPQLGQRDEFWRDWSLDRRRRGWSRDQILTDGWQIFQRMESSGANPWEDYFAWENVVYKVNRDEERVRPDPQLTGGFLSWSKTLDLEIAAVTVTGAGDDVPGASRGIDVVGTAERVVLGTPPDFATELTETGNAHRFVRLFVDRVVFVPGVGWHIWNGVIWRLDQLNDVFDMTQDVLLQIQYERERARLTDPEREGALRQWYERSSGMRAREAVLKGAQADRRLKVLWDLMNADPFLLVVQNGTLDLRTGTLRASQPTDYNTQVANVRFDPQATCPMWLRHVNLITQHADGTPDTALAAYLQRWAGYSLTGLVKEQKFFFGHGGGNNGKNVFIETLLNMLGSYAIRGSAQVMTGNGTEHETIIADLMGARMVFIDETPKGKINENRIKALTGTSRIRARKIKKDSVEFEARFKLWIAGNNKPIVGDTTKGFWRRLALVPFDTTITEVIPDYSDVLKAEWSGILNWCLEGLAAYRELGGLGEPERVIAAGEEYREEENTFGQFVEQYFDERLPHEWSPNNALHAAYKEWSEAQGVRNPPSMQRLANDWKRAGFRPGDQRSFRQGFVRRWSTQRGWVGPALRHVPGDMTWPEMQDRVVKDEIDDGRTGN